jgi:hypothetical protein
VRTTIGRVLAVLLIALVVGCLEVVWITHRRAVHVGAFVIIINLAGDCDVRIPPSRNGKRMLCRDVPDYLQKDVKLPLGSVFVVIEYHTLPREVTNAIAGPLQERGYEFGMVTGPEIMGAGNSTADDHPVREE